MTFEIILIFMNQITILTWSHNVLGESDFVSQAEGSSAIFEISVFETLNIIFEF